MRASIHGKIPTAPIREEGSDLEEEDVPEPPLNRLDAIALLPTPSAPAFRFVIGGDQSTRNYEKHYNEQQENGEKENAVHERPEINWGAADEYELALTGVLDSEGGRGELFGPSPSEKAVFGGQEDIEEQHVARAEVRTAATLRGCSSFAHTCPHLSILRLPSTKWRLFELIPLDLRPLVTSPFPPRRVRRHCVQLARALELAHVNVLHQPSTQLHLHQTSLSHRFSPDPSRLFFLRQSHQARRQATARSFVA